MLNGIGKEDAFLKKKPRNLENGNFEDNYNTEQNESSEQTNTSELNVLKALRNKISSPFARVAGAVSLVTALNTANIKENNPATHVKTEQNEKEVVTPQEPVVISSINIKEGLNKRIAQLIEESKNIPGATELLKTIQRMNVPVDGYLLNSIGIGRIDSTDYENYTNLLTDSRNFPVFDKYFKNPQHSITQQFLYFLNGLHGTAVPTEVAEELFVKGNTNQYLSNIYNFDTVDDFYDYVLARPTAQYLNTIITRSVEKNIDEFAIDPSLRLLQERNFFTKVPACLHKYSRSEQKEWTLRILRNLYVSRLEPTEENFESVFNQTREIRQDAELLNQSIFKNRNVAVFAHNEILTDSVTGFTESRFGNDKTIDGILRQNPVDVSLFKSADNTVEDLKRKKESFLNYVATHDSLTVLVSAHGSSWGIFLTKGVPVNGIIEEDNVDPYEYISPLELTYALTERYNAGFKDAPIFIFESCYNQDYIRSVYDEMLRFNQNNGVNYPLPIMAGSTEFGQYGYSNFDSEYKDKHVEAMLDGMTDTKIKDLIEIEETSADRGIITNQSIFIPVKQTLEEEKNKTPQKFFQIAETLDNKERQNSHNEGFAQGVQSGIINEQTASYFEQVQPTTAKQIRDLLKTNQETTEADTTNT